MTKDAFVAAVLEAVAKADIPESVEESASAIAKTIKAECEVFVAGELLNDEEPKLGQSKVGGEPHVDKTFVWPTEDDDDEAPLQFIAQFNLAEVHPHDFDRKLPATGMLYFFSIADGDRAYGGEIDESTTKVIFAAKPGALSPRAIPDELAENEDATIEERVIAFGPTLQVDSMANSEMRDVIREAVLEADGKDGPVYLLHARPEDRKSVMLADLDCYKIAQNAFGEGILGFAISKANLAKGAFDKADTLFNAGS